MVPTRCKLNPLAYCYVEFLLRFRHVTMYNTHEATISIEIHTLSEAILRSIKSAVPHPSHLLNRQVFFFSPSAGNDYGHIGRSCRPTACAQKHSNTSCIMEWTCRMHIALLVDRGVDRSEVN